MGLNLFSFFKPLIFFSISFLFLFLLFIMCCLSAQELVKVRHFAHWPVATKVPITMPYSLVSRQKRGKEKKKGGGGGG